MSIIILFQSLTKNISFYVMLESHNQWGRPGGPQGAAMGCSGEDAEGEANSLISQTVAMAIAGTSTASPISRPSSFLLNSQVIAVITNMGPVFHCSAVGLMLHFFPGESSTW